MDDLDAFLIVVASIVLILGVLRILWSTGDLLAAKAEALQIHNDAAKKASKRA